MIPTQAWEHLKAFVNNERPNTSTYLLIQASALSSTEKGSFIFPFLTLPLILISSENISAQDYLTKLFLPLTAVSSLTSLPSTLPLMNSTWEVMLGQTLFSSALSSTLLSPILLDGYLERLPTERRGRRMDGDGTVWDCLGSGVGLEGAAVTFWPKYR